MMLCLLMSLSVQVDQAKIDEAIRKGVAYLKNPQPAPPKPSNKHSNYDELILWTYLHAGVPENDPQVQALLKEMLEAPLQIVYRVALQAMILEELDRVRYQGRIRLCAQFLVDNQCVNGQWSYGTPSPAIVGTPSEGARPVEIATGARDFAGPREKPKVTRKLPVQKTREGPPTGDNSNSQYAALGLRACRDAGIKIPREVLVRAKRWWVESQHKSDDREPNTVITGGGDDGRPRGWCYCSAKGHHDPYGSMTAGAVGTVAIFDMMLDFNWKSDKTVKDGLAWLAKNYSVTENKGPCQHNPDPKAFWLYYMYALERAGILVGAEKIGGHDWYQEGAQEIVAAQQGNGSWKSSAYVHNHPIPETCFAILFLKRATRPLVASEDRAKTPAVEQK